MLSQIFGTSSKIYQQNPSKYSKFSVRKHPKIIKTGTSNSNFPLINEKSSRKDMLDPKVDQLTSVDINMEDVVDDVIMDSDENEDIIPKSPEE